MELAVEQSHLWSGMPHPRDATGRGRSMGRRFLGLVQHSTSASKTRAVAPRCGPTVRVLDAEVESSLFVWKPRERVAWIGCRHHRTQRAQRPAQSPGARHQTRDRDLGGGGGEAAARGGSGSPSRNPAPWAWPASTLHRLLGQAWATLSPRQEHLLQSSSLRATAGRTRWPGPPQKTLG